MKRFGLGPVFSVPLVALCGCGGGDSKLDADVVDAPGQEAPVASPFCSDRVPLATVTDVSGTWAVRLVGAQIVLALGTTIRIQNVFYLLYDMRQDNGIVSIKGRYCDRVEIDPPGALVPVIIPPAWAHTEKLVERSGSFAAGAGGFPVLTLSPAVEISGAVLANSSDPLPSDSNLSDPRILDEDRDGQPGITVVLNGQSISGSVFSVQRQTTSGMGVVVAADRIEGSLVYASEQNVLGSVPDSIKAAYKLATSTSDPTLCSSTFAMVKVAGPQALDGGTTAADGGDVDGGAGAAVTCAWVRANEAVLFPPR